MRNNNFKSKNFFNRYFVLSLFFFISINLLYAQKPEKISVVLDDNYPPYIFKTPEGESRGILVDLWALWEKKTGIKTELHAMDWGKAQSEMQSGKYDVIDTIFHTPERAKIYDFTKPYTKIEVPIFFHSNITGIVDPASVKGFTIGVKKGDACIEFLKSSGIKQDNLKEYDSYEKIIEAASRHELVVFCVDKPPALYFLYKMNMYQEFKSTESLYTGEFHRAVIKGNTKILKIVEDGFAKISKSEFTAIENKWYGTKFWTPQKIRHIGIFSGIVSVIILFLILYNYSLNRKVALRTEQVRKALNELKESQDELKAVMENVPGVVFRIVASPPWKPIHLGEEILNLLGFPANDFISGERTFRNYTVEEDVEKLNTAIDTGIKRRGSYAVEYRIKHSSGNIKWVYEKGICIFDEKGNPQFLNGVILDITERRESETQKKKFEEHLRQSQKLESLGVLAGGIAHDFNNLLMMIMGNADIAALEIPPESQAHMHLDAILSASKRAADLCRQMLAYAGKGKFITEKIDLRELIKEMSAMIEASVSKKIDISYDFQVNLPSIFGDAAQIKQVIMNLVTNSSESIGDEKGRIEIIVCTLNCTKEYFAKTFLKMERSEGEYVSLRISDTGCGMSEEVKAKLFDPFFTTKFTGRGLGMPAVLGIVKGHNGDLTINSLPGKGTTVEIIFPKYDKDDKNGASVDTQPRQLGITGKVILADDEDAVLKVGKRMLEKIGFTVLTAMDGGEAVQLYKMYKEEISCVILDLTMPVIDGIEAYKQIKKYSSDAKVILSSGYNETDILKKLSTEQVIFIQKPYRLNELTEKLRALFEQKNPE